MSKSYDVLAKKSPAKLQERRFVFLANDFPPPVQNLAYSFSNSYKSLSIPCGQAILVPLLFHFVFHFPWGGTGAGFPEPPFCSYILAAASFAASRGTCAKAWPSFPSSPAFSFMLIGCSTCGRGWGGPFGMRNWEL